MSGPPGGEGSGSCRSRPDYPTRAPRCSTCVALGGHLWGGGSSRALGGAGPRGQAETLPALARRRRPPGPRVSCRWRSVQVIMAHAHPNQASGGRASEARPPVVAASRGRRVPGRHRRPRARIDAAPAEQVVSFDGVAVEGGEGECRDPRGRASDLPPDGTAAPVGGEERPVYTREFAGERGYTPGFAGERGSGYSRQDRILDMALELRLVVRGGARSATSTWRATTTSASASGEEAALDTLTKFPHLVEELEDKADRIRPDWRKRVEPPAVAPPPPLNPREFAPGKEIAVNRASSRTGSAWRRSGRRGRARRPASSCGRTSIPRTCPRASRASTSAIAASCTASTSARRTGARSAQAPSLPRDARTGSSRRRRTASTGSTTSRCRCSWRGPSTRRSVREQFLAFPVGLPVGNDDEMNSASFDEFGRMTANLGLEAVPATPGLQQTRSGSLLSTDRDHRRHQTAFGAPPRRDSGTDLQR